MESSNIFQTTKEQKQILDCDELNSNRIIGKNVIKQEYPLEFDKYLPTAVQLMMQVYLEATQKSLASPSLYPQSTLPINPVKQEPIDDDFEVNNPCIHPVKSNQSRLVKTEDMEIEIIDLNSTQQHDLWPLEPATKRSNIQCQICLKLFSRRYNLSRHRLIHTREKSFQCQYCPKAYNRKDSLVHHVTINTGKKDFHCHLCSLRSFSTKTALQCHLIAHSDLRPYACSICPKTFKFRRCLQRHQTCHKSERPYNCDICALSFAGRRYIVSHMQVHIQYRPHHKCECCDLMFKRRYILKIHMRNKHGINFKKAKPETIIYKNFNPRLEFIYL